MANKTITDGTATTTVAATDVFELEQTGPSTKKITGANLAIGLKALARSGCLAKKAADQTAANYSASANLTWDSEASPCYDTDGYHSTVSNTDRFTAPVDGYYEVGCNVVVSSLASSDYVRIFCHRYNSGGVQQSDVGLPNSIVTEISAGPNVALGGRSWEFFMAAGDYIVFQLDTESDASITVEEETSWAGIKRVG